MNKYFCGLSGLFSSTPTYVILYVTARCNANCRMCFYWRAIDSADSSKELSVDEVEKISRSFGFLQYVTLTGGEPTLRDDLPEIARIFDRNNKAQFISIPTNSLLVEKTKGIVEEILHTSRNAYLKMCLSLDGLGADHDEIRGAPGCFENVVNNYRNMAALKTRVKDFEIMVNMTVSRFNYKKVGEVIKYVKRHMPLAVFNFVWVRGEARDAQSKNIASEEYKNIYELSVREEANCSSGFHFAQLLTVNRMIAREIIYAILKSGKRLHKCFAGKKMVIISEDGEVKPCEMLGENLGNLRDYDYDIQKILSNQKAKDILKLIARKSCFCTFENAIGNSVIHNPLFYAKLMAKMFKSRFHSLFC